MTPGMKQAFREVAFCEWGILIVVVVLIVAFYHPLLPPLWYDSESIPTATDTLSIAKEVVHLYYRYASETVWAPDGRYGVFSVRRHGRPDTIHVWYFDGDLDRMVATLNGYIESYGQSKEHADQFRENGYASAADWYVRFYGLAPVSAANYKGPTMGWSRREAPTIEGFNMWLNRGRREAVNP